MQEKVHQNVGAVKAGRVRFDSQPPDRNCVVRIGAPFARFSRWRNHEKIRGFYGETFRFDMRGRGDWTLATHNRAISQMLGQRLSTCLSKAVLTQLERLRAVEGSPYALIKAASYWGPLFPSTPEEYAKQVLKGRKTAGDRLEDHPHSETERRLRAVDSFAAGLLGILGSVPEFRIIGGREPIVRDLLTAPLMPELNDRSTRDMPLRFHQSTTEKDLPGAGAGKSDGFVCDFKIFTCMWNYRSVPIYLLTVKDLLDALPEEGRGGIIETLQKPIFDKIGPRADIGVSSRSVNDARLLMNKGTDQDPDWLLSFDPGRVWAEDDPEGRNALLVLRDTLRRVSRKPCVREIILDRRDVLVVDNMRALVSRREHPGGFGDAFSQMAAGPRKRRWLRLMYGYPQPMETPLSRGRELMPIQDYRSEDLPKSLDQPD
ncbi:MAG: hypothetical protein AAF603_08220 [Pseudomonadota bacterium]